MSTFSTKKKTYQCNSCALPLGVLRVSQAALRDGYLEDTLRLIRRQDIRGLSSLEEAQAAGRRLEALATDALARGPRFATLRDMAEAVERGNYHSKEQIIGR